MGEGEGERVKEELKIELYGIWHMVYENVFAISLISFSFNFHLTNQTKTSMQKILCFDFFSFSFHIDFFSIIVGFNRESIKS